MSLRKTLLSTAAVATCLALPAPAYAGSEPFIGQLMTFGGTFCPQNYTRASGQILSIASNTALFSLLGTTYGGNGQTTFALPNLNGRSVINSGQGPGLPAFNQGQQSGSNQINLTAATMPAHAHVGTLRAVPAAGDTEVPTGNSLAVAPTGTNIYSTSAPANRRCGTRSACAVPRSPRTARSTSRASRSRASPAS
jgi:microcystin-dependent protein